MLDGMARAHLRVPVRLVAATRPVPLRLLTAGEREQLDRLSAGEHRRHWLLGRAALKALCGPEADTSALAFPHPRLSLTHAGGMAVALGVGVGVGIRVAVAGAGVDFEPWRRRVVPAVARFILSPVEAAAAGGTSRALLRLWTVKEALFKATPDNADAVFVDYHVADASAPLGTAQRAEGEAFRYASVSTAVGVLTVAVCVARGVGDVAV